MHRGYSSVGFALGCVLTLASRQAPMRAQSQAAVFPSCQVDPEGYYGTRPARSVYVRMRDGVRIALEIVLGMHSRSSLVRLQISVLN
jgi:hypothetical protein